MFETVEFTNMCMICDNTKVVVIDRKNENWPGVTFPGGHVEPGESFTDAVIREVREETGLTIHAPRLCGVKDWYEDQRRYVVLFYKTNRFEGTLVSSAEGEVWWEETRESSEAGPFSGYDGYASGLHGRRSERVFLLSDGAWVEIRFEVTTENCN